jgi:hypothetical protein
MREVRVYDARCPECGPKGQALVSGKCLPDYFCSFVGQCFCEFIAVPNTLVNTAEVMQGEFISAPPKQSKSAQKHAAMLERCFRGPDARKEMP